MGLRSFKLSSEVSLVGTKEHWENTHTSQQNMKMSNKWFWELVGKMLARSSKHKLPQRFLTLQHSRIFLGWFSCLNNVRAKADLQPINLLHHSSLNFLRNYCWLLHHSSLNFLGNYYGLSTYTILPWISLQNSPGRRGTNNKLMSPWPIILLLLVLIDSKRSCPCTWPLSFLFLFFPFSFFLLISKFFKKETCCWKENRIYTGNTHISNFLSFFLVAQINVPKSHWIFFSLPTPTRKYLKHQVQSTLYDNH